MHDLIVGWSADTTVTDGELNAGTTSTTDTLTIPTETGNDYLFIWRSDADGGDPSEVHIAGGLNVRNTLGAATARTLDSVAGQLIVSVVVWNADLNSGLTLRVV